MVVTPAIFSLQKHCLEDLTRAEPGKSERLEAAPNIVLGIGKTKWT